MHISINIGNYRQYRYFTIIFQANPMERIWASKGKPRCPHPGCSLGRHAIVACLVGQSPARRAGQALAESCALTACTNWNYFVWLKMSLPTRATPNVPNASQRRLAAMGRTMLPFDFQRHRWTSFPKEISRPFCFCFDVTPIVMSSNIH